MMHIAYYVTALGTAGLGSFFVRRFMHEIFIVFRQEEVYQFGKWLSASRGKRRRKSEKDYFVSKKKKRKFKKIVEIRYQLSLKKRGRKNNNLFVFHSKKEYQRFINTNLK